MLNGAILYEVYMEVKLNVEHFRFFGSLVREKDTWGKIKEMQDKIKPMVFFGYEVDPYGDNCNEHERRRVHIS